MKLQVAGVAVVVVVVMRTANRFKCNYITNSTNLNMVSAWSQNYCGSVFRYILYMQLLEQMGSNSSLLVILPLYKPIP